MTLLESGCSEGHSSSCEDLASIYWKGAGVTIDRGRALAIWSKGCRDGECVGILKIHRELSAECDAGSTEGCRRFGSFLDEERETMSEADRRIVRGAYEKACANKDVDACKFLASFHLDGRGQDLSIPEGVAALSAACSAGDLQSCKRADSLKSVEVKCSAHDAEACDTLVTELTNPPVSAGDRHRTFEILGRECERGQIDFCLRAAELMNDGENGIPVDLNGSISFLRKIPKNKRNAMVRYTIEAFESARQGCDNGSAESCRKLAEHYRPRILGAPEKEEVQRSADWSHSAEAGRRACELGSAPACLELANLLLKMPSPVYSESEGLSLIDQACMKSVPDCMEQIVKPAMQTVLSGIPPKMIVSLVRSGCDAGDGQACYVLGQALQEGELGLKQDAPAALEAYRRACDAKHEIACYEIQ